MPCGEAGAHHGVTDKRKGEKAQKKAQCFEEKISFEGSRGAINLGRREKPCVLQSPKEPCEKGKKAERRVCKIQRERLNFFKGVSIEINSSFVHSFLYWCSSMAFKKSLRAL